MIEISSQHSANNHEILRLIIQTNIFIIFMLWLMVCSLAFVILKRVIWMSIPILAGFLLFFHTDSWINSVGRDFQSLDLTLCLRYQILYYV